MISRYNAAVNGTWISEISDSIVVVDISEDHAEQEISYTPYAERDGSRFIRQRRNSLSVSVLFTVMEQDVERRKDIISRVQTWAAGTPGNLIRVEINDRPGQFLFARCTEFPSVASAHKWQEQLRVQFAAYERPYWLDSIPSSATVSGSVGTMFVPGAGETLCEVSVENVGSNAVTTIRMTVGETSITVSSLNLSTGRSLVLVYDDYGRLSIKSGVTDALARRTPESADDLIAVCGKNNVIGVSSDGSVRATFKARGVYP